MQFEYYFKDYHMLWEIMKISYELGEGAYGRECFKQFLIDSLKFEPHFAAYYASFVMSVNDENSRDWMSMHARRIVNTWKRGNTDGSAGNLFRSHLETRIFKSNLTYEFKTEQYESYTNPFGQGYASPSSSSTAGYWVPFDKKTDIPTFLLIPLSGEPYMLTVDFTNQDSFSPGSCIILGNRWTRQ